MRLILAAALVLPVLGCAPDAELAARQTAEPAAIAAAICREVRTTASGECEHLRLADRTSEIAYATCLDYFSRDVRACGRLRQAYEDAVRAQLAAQKPASAPLSVLFYKRPAPGDLKAAGPQPGGQAPPAEALYKAASSDADTFQAALLVPEVRKKIEAALGKKLSDAQLRALIDNNRAEAVYWYGRMTHSQPAHDTGRTTPGG